MAAALIDITLTEHLENEKSSCAISANKNARRKQSLIMISGWVSRVDVFAKILEVALQPQEWIFQVFFGKRRERESGGSHHHDTDTQRTHRTQASDIIEFQEVKQPVVKVAQGEMDEVDAIAEVRSDSGCTTAQ